ncbi:MAG: hypothetical protein GF317_06780 [Candidatus Lokiarchaeota archaeon]|nr:hypothetical protein [Candidatus Lokiarchaeota archaeon]MBD3199414.1 hypothetical protein [Candidatus Lokiarchaeota archaeon]
MDDIMMVIEKIEQPIELKGFGLFKLNNIDGKWNLEILVQKGIGIPLIENFKELYQDEIIKNQEGNSIIPLDEYFLQINYYKMEEDCIIIFIYMNDKENSFNYAQIYLVSKKILNFIRTQTDFLESELNDYCDTLLQIPKAKGLGALFIISSSGSPFISVINQKKINIAKNEVHIGGFISAIFSFSQEIIGQESGAKLKEINFGDQRLYVITKGSVIFALLVKELNPLLQRYIYIIADEFLDKFKTKIKEFSGDISPFRTFRHTITKYFEI